MSEVRQAIELALLVALPLVAVAWATRGSSRRAKIGWIAGTILALLPLAWSWRASHAQDPRAYLPMDQAGMDGYVSSRTCRACHEGAHASWWTTYHRTMTQPASPETVLADWNTTLTHRGRSYVVRRDGDRFLVDMPRHGTLGQAPEDRLEREVVMMTGSHNQQLYWYAVPWMDEPPEAEGAEVYANHCAACHGEHGKRDEHEGQPIEKLRGEEHSPDDVIEALEDEDHESVSALDESQQQALLRHMERLSNDNRLMQFPFAWLVRDDRWVHEDYTFLDPPEKPLEHPEPEPYDQGWSNACDQCHSVNPGFVRGDLGPGEAAVVDLGIACESCHGPAQSHVAHHRAPWNRYLEVALEGNDVVVPNELSPELSASVCGQCHSDSLDRDDAPDRPFLPGDRLEDFVWIVQRDLSAFPRDVRLELIRDGERISGGYWDDGTVRVVGRDYNGLALTPCHTDGEMDCTTCHSMHASDPVDQLAPDAVQGDAMCSSCHEAIDASHSRHPTPADGGPGCYDCHMPRTTWGLLTAVRAHRVDSPSAIGLWNNRPSACTLCHTDLTRKATAEALMQWYEQPPHEMLAHPQALSGHSALLLLALQGDAVQRAVAAVALGYPEARRSGEVPPAVVARVLVELLVDPYTAVRYAAIHALAELPGYAFAGDADYLGPEEARNAMRERVIASAREQARSLAPNPALFLGDSGFDEPALAKAIERRDDRRVSVNE